ncbi:IS66 family insertion sequence element accessory protein TnpA [Microcella sp.]|uniref:IS66 family insertion sequence element accessory protein TnpA n=1 Tax=Microcella sp. TaxID=1913979 RepID=UPI00299F5B58|nr:hypothetical protein [Microcella sp.]MDX2026981.1 hypothetical protein [Microcella sp.]
MKEPIWKQKARDGRHWDEDDARSALAHWAESGESLSGFARRHALSTQRLSWWRTRVSAEGVTATTSLLPVTVTAAPLVSFGGSAVSVRVGEVRIEVDDPSRVPTSWVAALVFALNGATR